MVEALEASTPPLLPQTQATAADACTAWEAGTVPARPSLPLLLSRWLETGLKQEKKTCLLKSANILGKEGEPSLVWLLWERFRINYQWERSLPWTELQPPRAPHPGAHTPAQEAVETSRHSETSPWPLLSWSPLPRDGQPFSAAPSGLALAQRTTPRSSPASLPPT